jgi:uncharacterized membrane protein
VKNISLVVMTVFYIVTGVNHFINPQFYKSVMPAWVPFHDTVIIISGIFEILFALLLIFQSTRRIGAWSIIVLLIAVFPANIQAVVNNIDNDSPLLWMSVLRLPLQVVLILWAYTFAKREKYQQL